MNEGLLKQKGRLVVFGGAFLAMIAVSGCGHQTDVTCSSDDGVGATINMIRETIEKDSLAKSKQDDGTYLTSPSKIRATLALLKIVINDIRTSKIDPNSTKKFCVGNAKITVPIQILNDADSARSMANLNSVEQLADVANVQRSADNLTFSIDYSVQPTDDKKSTYAESDSIGPQMQFVAEVISSALIKSKIENQKTAQQQEVQQQQFAQKQAIIAENNQAKVDNRLSGQAIGAAWNAIDIDTRSRILPIQRVWISAKVAECNVRAASASTDSVEQDTARLKCDTEQNQARMDWLRQYMPN